MSTDEPRPPKWTTPAPAPLPFRCSECGKVFPYWSPAARTHARVEAGAVVECGPILRQLHQEAR